MELNSPNFCLISAILFRQPKAENSRYYQFSANQKSTLLQKEERHLSSKLDHHMIMQKDQTPKPRSKISYQENKVSPQWFSFICYLKLFPFRAIIPKYPITSSPLIPHPTRFNQETVRHRRIHLYTQKDRVFMWY